MKTGTLLQMLRPLAALACMLTAAGCGQNTPASVPSGPGNKTTLQYEDTALRIGPLSAHTWLHTSYLATQQFGKVDCNGWIILDADTAVIFDTPADSLATARLLALLDSTGIHIKAVVVTHFHADCLAGLSQFHTRNIPSYAQRQTPDLAAASGTAVPRVPFDTTAWLYINGHRIELYYPGPGHTADNITGYLEADSVLFGGCLVKAMGADKGNLADADTVRWPASISRILARYPYVKVVIPGHGEAGDRENLRYTEALFR